MHHMLLLTLLSSAFAKVALLYMAADCATEVAEAELGQT